MCEFLAGGCAQGHYSTPGRSPTDLGSILSGGSVKRRRNRRRGRRFVDRMGATPLGERVVSTRVSLMFAAHSVGRKKP